jgi:hypothetical protein
MTWHFEEERFILCEGPHDEHFLKAFINRRGLPPFQVKDAHTCCGTGGRSGFSPSIQGFSTTRGFTELKGIVIITDNDNEEAFTETQEALGDCGYRAPANPMATGLIEDKPVLIILMPSHIEYGNLEKICLPSLYEKWPEAEQCVKMYLECTRAVTWEKQHELCKAAVRSVISGFYEDDPYKGLGYLFRDHPDLADHDCFNGLADILNRFDEIVAKGSF